MNRTTLTRGVATAAVAALLALTAAPAARGLDLGGPGATGVASRGLLAGLQGFVTLIFMGGENRSQIDPNGATASGGQEGDNRSQIDPDGAVAEGDNRIQIDPNG